MDNQRISREQWTRFLYPLSIEKGKKVKAVTFNLKANHEAGDINITDLQLQVGKQISADIPHTSEMLIEQKHGIDEKAFLATVSTWKKKGVQPVADGAYSNIKNRVFNIVGRGHEVVALPNVFHEDYKEELLTSGLDLELYAKEPFDLLRISTNDGALVLGRKYDENGPLFNHSLNYKYTREFYFEAGVAGEKITLSAKLNKATIGNRTVPIGQRTVTVGSGKMKFARQRLMVAPFGSFRLRIEFYKQVAETVTNSENGTSEYQTYLKNVGIGFYGTAQFKQVKGNHKF